MGKIDAEKERLRLAKLYSSMSDGELEKIASESLSLTTTAREVLIAEISRRNLGLTVELPEEKPEAKSADSGPQEPDTDEPIVLRRYRDLPNALVVKSLLESAGIESFLADDNVIRMDWLISNALGGVKVLVRLRDLAEANKVLDENPPDKFDVEGVGEYEQPKCPNCGSVDISFEELDRKIAYVGLFIRLPIPATLSGWNCHSCGHSWGATETGTPA